MLSRYRQLLITIGVLVGIALAVTQAIKPTIDGIFETQGNIESARGKLAALSAKEELLRKEPRDRLALQAKKLDDVLPSVIDLSVIVATLQKVASDTEISLSEFSISSMTQAVTILPTEETEKLSNFQFKVALSGNFENTKRFIDRLGFVSPMLRMENLDFADGKSQAVINFYFQPKLSTKPSVDSPLVTLSDSNRKAIDEVFRLESPVLEEPLVGTPAAEPSRENPFR